MTSSECPRGKGASRRRPEVRGHAGSDHSPESWVRVLDRGALLSVGARGGEEDTLPFWVVFQIRDVTVAILSRGHQPHLSFSLQLPAAVSTMTSSSLKSGGSTVAQVPAQRWPRSLPSGGPGLCAVATSELPRFSSSRLTSQLGAV